MSDNETLAFAGGYTEPNVTEVLRDKSLVQLYLEKTKDKDVFEKVLRVSEDLQLFVLDGAEFSTKFNEYIKGDKDFGFLVTIRLIKDSIGEDVDYNDFDLRVKEKLCQVIDNAVGDKSGIEALPYMELIADITGLMVEEHIENDNGTKLYDLVRKIYEQKSSGISPEKDTVTSKIANDLEVLAKNRPV